MFGRIPCLLATFAFCCTGVAESGASKSETKLIKHPEALSARLQSATKYSKENHPEKVIELLNSYTDQLDSGGFLLLASSYSELKDYANEVRVLTILMNQDEENFRWHMLTGQAYIKQAGATTNEEKKADLLTSGIQQMRRTLALNKKFKPAYDLLLKTLLDQKANNEGRELILEGIEKFGERPELYRELCRLDSLDGFLEQAVKSCRRSIELSPTFPDHYVYLVQALRDQGEDNLAERNVVSAAKRFPQSEFVQFAAGKIFFLKKNYSVAARYYLAATKANPKEMRSQFGLAQSQYESGQEMEALEHFIIACKGDASTLDVFLAAGARLKQKGNDQLGGKYAAAAHTCR